MDGRRRRRRRAGCDLEGYAVGFLILMIAGAAREVVEAVGDDEGEDGGLGVWDAEGCGGGGGEGIEGVEGEGEGERRWGGK